MCFVESVAQQPPTVRVIGDLRADVREQRRPREHRDSRPRSSRMAIGCGRLLSSWVIRLSRGRRSGHGDGNADRPAALSGSSAVWLVNGQIQQSQFSSDRRSPSS